MAGQRVFVEFDDFRGGESGTATGKNAPDKSFNGTNVLAAVDGSIIPRCGLLDVSPASGVSDGKIAALGIVHRDLAADFFYVQGTHVYNWSVGGALSDPYDGTLAVEPDRPCSIVSRNADAEHFVTVSGDKTYIINHLAETVTAIDDSPGGDCIAQYGVRLMVGAIGDDGIEPSRIAFSGDSDDPTDYTIWDPLNYINVPGDPGLRIRGMYPMRDYLLIVRKGGELWRLSGTPGVDDELRQISGPEQSFAAYQDSQGIVTIDNQFWCVGLASTAPRYFNGGSLKALEALGTENVFTAVDENAWVATQVQTDVVPPQFGAVSPSPDGVAFFGRDRGLLRRHGAWSKHEFDDGIVGWAVHHTNGAVLLSDGGDDAAHPKFWVLNTGDDRPPIKGKGVWSRDSVGDDSDIAPNCLFATPEWWDKQGRRVLVREVIVTFTEYDTALLAEEDEDDEDLFNHFGVQVTALDRYGLEAQINSATQEYLADPRPNTQPGIRRRQVFGFGDQGLGQGFKIRVSHLRGIKINSLMAVVDITEGTA